jgi:hypothetical protein
MLVQFLLFVETFHKRWYVCVPAPKFSCVLGWAAVFTPKCRQMVPESDNYVWGRSDNVWNAARTPGGSSGGDAALVAYRASYAALGGDIGGSLRLPASFSGIATFKATPARVTRCGAHMPRHAPYGTQPSIKPVAGPMARRVDDLVLIMQHTWWTRVGLYTYMLCGFRCCCCCFRCCDCVDGLGGIRRRCDCGADAAQSRRVGEQTQVDDRLVRRR